MSNLSLRDAILEELEFQPHINAANIGVAVENGVVTLTGHVDSYDQKISAERAVKASKACARWPRKSRYACKGAGTADDTIASRALHIIDWSADVPDNAVKVIVQKGWVTLEAKWTGSTRKKPSSVQCASCPA
jgi:osmotically-inducible protein OsmY